MQTRLQVLTKTTRSLRDLIIRDLERQRDPWLEVIREKQPGRVKGWAKLRSVHGHSGVINICWDAGSRMLVCRAVTKRGNRPDQLLGDFVAYLLDRHWRRVVAINLQVR